MAGASAANLKLVAMEHDRETQAEWARMNGAVWPALRPGQRSEEAEGLLESVRARFYTGRPGPDFHRDRRMLLYALTWPAVWLERRGLTCPPARYQALVGDRLAEIALHGDPVRYGAYFPAYLLKCLQDWFHHHGEELYDELKHIRNALNQVLASVRLATAVQHDAKHIDLLAATHRLIHGRRAHREKPDDRQLSLL